MAIISIAKLLLLLCGLVTLLLSFSASRTSRSQLLGHTPAAILIALLCFAGSLAWTSAPQADALGSLAKYGKLLLVILMVHLIRNRREAFMVLSAFIGAQLFLLMSSWLLFFQVPVLWATSNMATTHYAVFSSYLDQGIISAVLAAVCWHLRGLLPWRYGNHVACLMALLALVNVFFVLSGRTGHVVAIALLSLAIMWELPKRYRAVVVALPFLLGVVLFVSSTKVRDRLTLVQAEVQAYSPETVPTTSSGIRLGLWLSAIRIMDKHPLAGAGVGSWSTEHNRQQRAQNPAHVDIQSNGNPHQEYLLWGVQLGLPGVALLLGLMAAVWRDALRMPKNCARAILSVLAALAVACHFNSSIYDALIGDFFCITLGLLLALGQRSTSSENATLRPRAAT